MRVSISIAAIGRPPRAAPQSRFPPSGYLELRRFHPFQAIGGVVGPVGFLTSIGFCGCWRQHQTGRARVLFVGMYGVKSIRGMQYG